MQYALCRHIKTNGIRCKAPSLTDGLWCYFHHRLHQRHDAFRHTEATRGYLIPGQHIELTALEDRESVQVALSVVINALATGKLDIKRATALLYGLQLASNNARGLFTEPYATAVIRSVEPSPEGLDLAQLEPAREIKNSHNPNKRRINNLPNLNEREAKNSHTPDKLRSSADTVELGSNVNPNELGTSVDPTEWD